MPEAETERLSIKKRDTNVRHVTPRTPHGVCYSLYAHARVKAVFPVTVAALYPTISFQNRANGGGSCSAGRFCTPRVCEDAENRLGFVHQCRLTGRQPLMQSAA